MTTAKKLMTAEELAALPNDGRRYELLDGVLHKMAPTNEVHDSVRTLLAIAFGGFVVSHRLGHVFTGDTGYFLRRNPDRVRAPDLSFKSRERLGSGGLSLKFSDIVPDLVIEIVSPGDRAVEVEQKALEWLAAGVRLVLNVYPETRSVLAYRSPTEVRRYTDADLLDAEPVLPGFSCPVAQLFPEE